MAAKEKVRVRFAPSPTGYLHVGGARTAIFNWLFARHHGGNFVLRIEDTDVERSTEESERNLIDDLRWLGLDWDEGPDVGGRTGPYRQSERLDRYRDQAAALVAAGVAYPCFCSDELLESKRQEAKKRGVPPQYDGTCRRLSAADIAAKRESGVAEVIRFRVPEGTVEIEDLVRGDVELKTDTVGDFVLIRSNGHPTYNFAVVVDDHAMEITHVLRGEEHLPNTLRQMLVYRAMDAEAPRFGHLPLILAEDRSKLSKRHGASSVGELRDLGYLPGAVVNYLALLGWSHPAGSEVFDMRELIDTFDIDRINKSAAVYDRNKLTWMNGRYIREAPLEELFVVADPFFPEHVRKAYSVTDRRSILGLLQDSLEKLADLSDASRPFLQPPVLDREALDAIASPSGRAVLLALEAALDERTDVLTAEGFKSMMKEIGKATSIKGKDLYFPVRAAVTGSVHGPDLAGVIALKGRETVRGLVERARTMDSTG